LPDRAIGRYSQTTLNHCAHIAAQFRRIPVSTLPPVSAHHFPLAAVVWPDRAAGAAGGLRAVILVVLGTALLTLSAKINLPLPYVPMTLQTLVVLMIGAAYGRRLGAATMVAYLAEGAAGLPVFAGPVGGLAPLLGPTAGYLVGFVVAAFLTGWLSAAAVCRDGDSAHRHFCVRLCLAGVRPQARRRQGLAGRGDTLHRGIRHQECAWCGTGAGAAGAG
jgi:hypothetical protein